MYIVNVNNFRPFDLFILLNAAFRNSNIAFSHAAGYSNKAYFMIPLFICVDGGPQENLRAAVIC